MAVQLLPEGKQSFTDSAGVPLVGGKVATYIAGTNTPKVTYSNTVGTPNTNPVILDGRGEATIFWDGAYKVVLQDAAGVVIWTVDQIATDDTSAAANQLRADLADDTNAAKGAGLEGFGILSYAASTVGGALFTTVWGAGATDRAAQLTAANALGLPIRIIGSCTVSSPVTITVPIVDTMAQIFATTAQITINNGLPVRPEWWGAATGNIMLAVNALPSTGGVVKLENKTYPPSYNTFTAAKFTAGTNVAGVDYLAKSNVRIVGSKLPTFKASLTGLENGTIIEGPFYAHADGFSIDPVGVDSGSDVCAARYAGVAQDALVIGQVSLPAPTYFSGVSIGRVRGICKSPASLVHACLFEAIDGGTVEYAEGAYAFHGVVIKSQNIKATYLGGFETGAESVILKSDSYAPMTNVQVAEVDARSTTGGVDPGFGLLIDAVSAAGSGVQVGTVIVYGKANGVCVRSNGAIMSDVSIGSVKTDQCAIGVLYSGDIRRVNIQSATVLNSTYGVQAEVTVTSPTVSIGKLKVANATDGINLQGLLQVEDASFESCSNYAVNYTNVAARLVLTTFRLSGVTNFWNQQLALSGAWVNEGSAGSPPFVVGIRGGKIQLSGWVKSGASSALYTLTTQTRPVYNRKFIVNGLNVGTEVPITVFVTAATGAVLVPNYASAPTYICLDGVEWDAP